ncbi:hypothetical protein [Streptomyces klenkii]|uniref:hypothetical protein n=1 Tax=Streptomyces klenkii TaxID=1420899 RepID=UPI003F4C8A98
MSLLHHDVRRETFAEASRFRAGFYACLTARRDGLFELADAPLCVDEPEFRFAKPGTWSAPAVATATEIANYGKATTQAWDRSLQNLRAGPGDAGDRGHLGVVPALRPGALG